jgi:hypothetical protein
MAVFTSAAFAAPLSAVGSLDELSRAVSNAEPSAKIETDTLADVEDEALFADVSSLALSMEEAQDVKGGVAWWLVAIAVATLFFAAPTPAY